MGPVARAVFKTVEAWQPHAGSVRLRRRSVEAIRAIAEAASRSRRDTSGMAVEDVEMLEAQWRTALDAAETALTAARVSLPSTDLHGRGEHLRVQRESAGTLLRQLGHDRRGFIYYPMLLPPKEARRRLLLPPEIGACVFGLDGVLVGAAEVHAAAWTTTLNEFLAGRSDRPEHPIVPFDGHGEYRLYMDGKPRLAAIRTFLASRGISLPTGAPDDPPGTATVNGIANRKVEVLLRLLEEQGPRAYADSHAFLEVVCDARILTAVHSTSAHTAETLERAGLRSLIDVLVDADVIAAEELRPRPAPDRTLAACRLLEIPPERTAAFETSAEGVEAARAAGCRYVVAVERHPRQAEALLAAGADIVVGSLGELKTDAPPETEDGAPPPRERRHRVSIAP